MLRAGAATTAGASAHHHRSATLTATAAAASAQPTLHAQPAGHAAPWLVRAVALPSSCSDAPSGEDTGLEQQHRQQRQLLQPMQRQLSMQLQAQQQQHGSREAVQQQQQHDLPVLQRQHAGQLQQAAQEQAMRLQQTTSGAADQWLRSQQQHKQQQQQRQRKNQKRQSITDAAVREALQSCNSWRSLGAYLQQQMYSQPQQQMYSQSQQQQQQSKPQQQLWQQLSSYQSQLVLQHTARLAGNIKQQQRSGPNMQPDAHSQQVSVWPGPPSALQQLLVLLARRATLRIAPGDEVIAAELLRAVGRLDICVQQYQKQPQQQQQQQQRQQQEQYQQQRQQQRHWQQQQQGRQQGQLGVKRRRRQLQELGQRLLDCMCCEHAPQPPALHTRAEVAAAAALQAAAEVDPAAGAAAAAWGAQQGKLRSAKLLGGLAEAVMQLQLKPNQHWLLWFEQTSMLCLQQDGQQQQQVAAAAEASPVNAQALVVYLQLALCIKQQQQQQQQTPAAAAAWPGVSWQQAWAAAACQLGRPFSIAQMLVLTSAVQQLQLQVPSSFWQRHLQASAVAAMPAQQLLQLLPQLPVPSRKQAAQQQQGLLPEDWRTAAAAALPAAACKVAAAAAAAAGHSNSSTRAAAAARLLPAAVWAAYSLQLPLSRSAVQQLLEALVAEQAHSVSTSNAVIITTNSSSSSDSSILQQVLAAEAARAVFALAQLTYLQPPPAPLLLQLQTSLLPLLPRCSTASLVDLLWVFAVKWRVQPAEPWLAAFLQASEQQLGACTAKQMRLLVTALALLQAQLPSSWEQAYLQATAAVLGLQATSSSSSSTVSTPASEKQQQQHVQGSKSPLQQQSSPPVAAAGQQQPSAAFLANVGYSLAQLQVTPPPPWQLTWQRCVLSQLQHMSPNQAIDTLCAAAAWAEVAQQQATAAGSAMAAMDVKFHGVNVGAAAAGEPPPQRSAAEVQVLGSSTSSSSRCDGTKPALLPKPQLRVATSRGELARAGRQTTWQQQKQQKQQLLQVLPNEAWIRSLLQHLRHLLPQCTPKQFTTALRCLRQLRYKASVAWMDAVCDALLSQLQHCSMLQLQQLLRGLLHQGHELAPARIDAVLDAALVLQGRQQCSEQQLVWLLQLVVQLHHEPEPVWTEQVAAAAECMLSSSSPTHPQSPAAPAAAKSSSSGSSSSSSGGWSPELLTDLLYSLAQLGPLQLPDSWPSSYRRAARRRLRQFSGSQLARLLSAAALLHWQVPRPFLQQLLRQLQLRMATIDAHALGLAGVAVGQLELPVCGGWTRAFLRRLQQLARSRGVRIAVSDANNLQRTVQYLRWCAGRARGLGVGRRCGKRRLVLGGGKKSSGLSGLAVVQRRDQQMSARRLRRTGTVQLPIRSRTQRQGRQ